MKQDQSLRRHLAKVLDWQDAHVGFDDAIADVPTDLWGTRPERLPYSLWQLLEHVRFTQRDILDFCRNSDYSPPKWPDDYWPGAESPPAPDSWRRSADAFRADRQELIAMVADETLDLFAEIPHGDGQTYLRELLLLADHNSYHLGEMIAVRRLLGIWH